MTRYCITKEALLSICEELFGKDPKRWRFRCPQCKHEQSGAEVLERNPKLVDVSGWIAFSCEGRKTEGVGCDWTLGGLFQIHELEWFEGGRYHASFMPAHDRAETLIAEAAKSFVGPKQLESDAKTWAEFGWPHWVPADHRKQVEKFWDWHGGPQGYLKNMRERGAPAFGHVVELSRMGSGEPPVGRFMHRWNNIGAVLTDEGEYQIGGF